MVVLQLDDVPGVDGELRLDVPAAAVVVANPLVLIGGHEEPFEPEGDESPVELRRHVLALVDDERVAVRGSAGRGSIRDDSPHAIPVDRTKAVGPGRFPRQGFSGALLEPVTEPPPPRGARQFAGAQLVPKQLFAGAVQQTVEDQEDVGVPLVSVAAGAEQRHHGLAGAGTPDDQVLPLRRQGAHRLLLLAQLVDARQLEPPASRRRAAHNPPARRPEPGRPAARPPVRPPRRARSPPPGSGPS